MYKSHIICYFVVGRVVGRLSMPNITSARKVETITDVGYHRCDSGLYLQVARGGSKSWLFRFKSPVTAKQREMGLGSLSVISLAQARNIAIECRQKLQQGFDPLEERRKKRQSVLIEKARSINFKEAAERCIENKKPEWKNIKHAQQWKNSLINYAYPILGHRSVSEIDTELILKVIEPIWISKAETASRVRQRIEIVLDWARARNYVQGENPARLRGHLDKILAKTNKVKRIKHHPAVPYNQINNFISLLRSKKGSSSLALEFMILTATRTSEVIGACWDEFDLNLGLWTIPPDRMKVGKEHRVPLSSQANVILKGINSNRKPEDFVFHGWKSGSGLSNGAMLMLMKKIGFGPYTPHGFRSTFRDWAAEKAYHFHNETVELALAHTIRNRSEAAYRRGDQLEKRRELMQLWSDYVEKT